jgi:hypothetical protein
MDEMTAMANFVAGLIIAGVKFEVEKYTGYFLIYLTGGY